ncbi:MAG TPA: cysteine--tRNA ligase [Candidatus Saccharimonadales bacterium]|nr:cysteine--tRNA ligase [Candidatus Saccharimonadales bacterium]
MKLTNTLTRHKEELVPLKDNRVTLYTCGPTVYDYVHIGNLRSFLFDDVLRRVLQFSGYQVRHVMNITDVGHLVSDGDEGEDKLEKGARREGKTVWDVAEHYTQAFKRDVELLNILAPNGYDSPKYSDSYARATEFIGAQIEMVQLLLDQGFAYQTTQAIYFDVTKLADYGILTGQKLSEKEVAVRREVVTDSDKHHPYDFAVWFFAAGHFKDHSMRWSSPWGEGFPGWHLECSAIIHATLGDPIDIHTGGIDHIGTHHTNEIAQTAAAFGHPLARVWVHNEFVLADGAKMAKSKDNFYTVKDITARGYTPLAFRLLILQAHYSSELNFTWPSLEAAQNFLLKLYAWADLRFQAVPGSANPDFSKRIAGAQAAFKEAVEDDLGTPQALAVISQLADWMERAPLPERDLEQFDQMLAQVEAVLGLGLVGRADIEAEAKQLIRQRQQARASQDYRLADQLRQQLLELRVEINDTPDGPRWRRS